MTASTPVLSSPMLTGGGAAQDAVEVSAGTTETTQEDHMKTRPDEARPTLTRSTTVMTASTPALLGDDILRMSSVVEQEAELRATKTNGYHATGIFGYGWSYTEILSVTLEVLRPFVSITHQRTPYLEPRRTDGIIHTLPFDRHFGRRKTKVESQLARLQCQNSAQRIQGHGGHHHSIATGESTIVLPCRVVRKNL